ncbi:radical SAM protein [candidate division KSB1 bacterium]|nr:radical SAM protein [candidate division KSB1 bacterium]
MKILLINPPIEDFYQTKIRQEPLGLSYISAVLRREHKNVTLLDAMDNASHQTIECPDELKYLKSFYPSEDISPFKLFTRFQHFGLPYQTIARLIKTCAPDIIGISANFSPYVKSSLKIAQIARQLFPDVTIVLGGHHVSAVPSDLDEMPEVDFIVIGEGEYTFLNLIENLSERRPEKLKRIKGIAFRDNGKIRINPPADYVDPLDALPYPDRLTQEKSKMILTSRGCPKNCQFCSVRHVMGRRVRLREITAIIEEINYWVHSGVSHFDFEDDNLLFYPDRARLLFKEIINQVDIRKLSFSALNGLDAEALDQELLHLMKQMHFTWLNLPLVSGHPEMQAQINRNQSRTNFLEVVEAANRTGLKVVAYLILGLPADSIDSMLADILLLAEKQVLIGPSIFYPPPGSPIYRTCLEKGLIRPRQYVTLRSSAIPVETDRFSRTDIVTLFRLVRIINYIKLLLDKSDQQHFRAEDFLKSRCQPDLFYSKSKLSAEELGLILLNDLIINKQLKGIRFSGKRKQGFCYQRFEYDVSSLLVEKFMENLKGRRIVGVETDHSVEF